MNVINGGLEKMDKEDWDAIGYTSIDDVLNANGDLFNVKVRGFPSGVIMTSKQYDSLLGFMLSRQLYCELKDGDLCYCGESATKVKDAHEFGDEVIVGGTYGKRENKFYVEHLETRPSFLLP